MAPSSSDVVKLRRNLGSRLLGATRLHAVLVVLLGLDVVVTVLLAVSGAGTGLEVAIFVLVVLFMGSAFGISASIAVEDTGIAWRYVVQHAFLWERVTQVRFTAGPRSVFGAATRPVIAVVMDGSTYGLTPAYGVSSARLLPFAQRLAGFAGARGVEVTVDDPRWGDIGRPNSNQPPRQGAR